MPIVASTSGLLPVPLEANVANYDPNEWVAVTGFSRGASFYAIGDEIGLGGSDMKTDYEALRR